MYRADTDTLSGSLDALRRRLGVLPEELTRCAQELRRTETADVSFGNGIVSITSRRRKEELKAKENNRLYVAKHRAKDECKDDVRLQSKSKSLKKEKEEEKDTEQPSAVCVPVDDSPGKKGKLPADFSITAEMRAWAAKKVPGLDIDDELEEFISFWRDIAAKNNKRTERGWVATWQGRMKEVKSRQKSPSNKVSRFNSSTIPAGLPIIRVVQDQ
jgi:hypothetical protein